MMHCIPRAEPARNVAIEVTRSTQRIPRAARLAANTTPREDAP